jgi:hypothetical protein
MPRKLRLRLCNESLLTIDRSRLWKKRLVYILVGDKPFKYYSGKRSYIIYIGTTAVGAGRPAASAAKKASELFFETHGLKQIGVFVVNCGGRRAVRTWRLLESALLTAFKDIYYDLPLKNKRRESEIDIDRYFNKRALISFLRRFENKQSL